jgi:hypothetical protein
MLVEGVAEPIASRHVDGELIVAASEVLHKCVTGGQGPSGPAACQARIGRSLAFSRP